MDDNVLESVEGNVEENKHKEVTNYDVDNLSLFVSKNILYILNGSTSLKMIKEKKWDEFELTLLHFINNLRKSWASFDKLDLTDMYSKDVNKELSQIIWLNYPSYRIWRLLPWEKVVNIYFKWIKDLNDNISKEFTDLFIWKLKDIVIGDFKLSLKNINLNWRLIRSNYKHITFSFDSSENINDLVFQYYRDIDKLLKMVFNNISDDELLSTSKWLSKEEVMSLVIKYFSFSTWKWIVDQSINNSKIIAFYDAEMSSRENKHDKSKSFVEEENNLQRIKDYAYKIKMTKRLIFNLYDKEVFIIDWNEHDVFIIDENWNKEINRLLYRKVRKWKEVLPRKLENLVQNYLNYLNNWFDFISPSLNSTLDRNVIDDINETIKTGILYTKYIEKNYKWTYTKNALECITYWKQWLNIFIDIIDMWILNLLDFESIAERIEKMSNKDDIYDELLQAWNSVTKLLIDFVESIQKKYDNLEVAIWGDEIFIFAEWENIEKDVITYISDSLIKKWLKWRLSLSYNHNEHHKDDKSNKVFDKLDNYTSINKIFEIYISKIIDSSLFKSDYEFPANSILVISEENRSYIDDNYQNILNNLKSNIIKKNVIEFIKEDLDRVIVAEFDGLKIYFEKEWNLLKIII